VSERMLGRPGLPGWVATAPTQSCSMPFHECVGSGRGREGPVIVLVSTLVVVVGFLLGRSGRAGGSRWRGTD
jgi:hypothetical protein